MKKVGLKGFTMIELIVVIAIIAVLAAVLVPSMIGYTRTARAAAITSNARNVYNAAKISVLEANQNVRIKVNPGEVYFGDDSGNAYAAGGSDDLSVGKYMGEDFHGHYAFVISADGNDVEYAVWRNNYAIDPSEVRMYTQDEMERGGDIGSYPNS